MFIATTVVISVTRTVLVMRCQRRAPKPGEGSRCCAKGTERHLGSARRAVTGLEGLSSLGLGA